LARNARIRAWFDRGNIAEALIGSPGYFIPSVTFSETPDRLLAVSELLLWADSDALRITASRSLLAATTDLAARGKLLEAFDLVWCYFLATDDLDRRLPLAADELRNALSSGTVMPQTEPTPEVRAAVESRLRSPGPPA
jgi:hypothetical protein